GSYFARFATPLPLDHLWSLSIEEQFYLVWPFVLLIGIWTLRNRLPLAILTLVAAGGSAMMMGHSFHVRYDPTRAYEGTDTRAFGLLIGAAVAMRWPTWAARRRVPEGVTNTLDVLGVVGFVVIAVLVWRTDSFTPFLYPMGFVLLSVATAAMVAA